MATEKHDITLNKEELADLLREFPTWGHAAVFYKRKFEEVSEKAQQYDQIMEAVKSNSLASDGLDMIQAAMRDD